MDNALNRDLQMLVKHFETDMERQQKNERDIWRLKFHLMPPLGWLNDPNGLCWHNGEYHVFFQYAPFNPEGGLKLWGHYKSSDFINWEYLEPALYPDQPYDIHGAYSGSGLSEDGQLYLFYTGNVKLSGDYDYITGGREGNTILAVSEDGIHFHEKKLLLKAEDYPRNLTCHVRDPKVWREGADYYMVLGARTIDDQGEILLYHSTDKEKWQFMNVIKSEEAFGYMWECPDLFSIDQKTCLLLSPQGVEQRGLDYQNIYQSGYYFIEGDFKNEYKLGEFTELDYGYDFYAPQTFLGPDGRRILIGWMGMPDTEDEYQNPTVAQGWQHALTFPRELSIRNGKIYQKPVRELELLKKRTVKGELETNSTYLFCQQEETFYLKLDLHHFDNQLEIIVKEGISLSYKEGIFSLKFINGCGFGRTLRQTKLEQLSSIEILCDTTSLEIFLNEGEKTLTTRYYSRPEPAKLAISGNHLKAALEWWAL